MDKAIVISEVQIMSVMEQMCAESLDPETFGKWSDVAEVLRITRKALGDKTAEMQGHQVDKMPNLQGSSTSLPHWMPKQDAATLPNDVFLAKSDPL